ncbi:MULTISPECIES: TRAP transporter large permease [unclassified Ruegeria]|uniref:TRAP transporter large permease n=1 Tax=unclassified Ruegeria TaxID=2625375 RepID=UPI00148981E3|nr:MULTISPECIES: TRAP transporter large permease [unclassified Ruegeria]NOD35756.1 TRAP transporter large permease subunit [Ruegeria sp. HKCCD7296]NOD47692.1 TRAP transporter large permease subunit [Ruegeria sp. HKCCD5849]NOD52645.1 TRAP transporter large permease subunit [Ruegeria sp. HKCCD5851]NOD66064.1 TRAP transporter large permease subunit [Ruegeria sp. HKCCD7303]NOE34321.1 TRAP transporter large permease subunit [Ruegeria sp. HKCCD7318]
MGTEIIYILFGGFLLLLFIGAPITVALGVSTLVTFLVLDENPIKFVQIAFTSVGSFPLMALPAFILAGALMEASGLSRRLINVAESFAGPFTGGMSAAAVFACLFFGAISGSGPATTAAVGMLMIPAMIQRNYSRDYASAITASSGGLGIVIPPSIPLIIFGIAALGMPPPPEAVAEHGTFQTVSIPKLFIAGFLPAFLIAGSLLIMNYILARKHGYKGTTEGWSARHIWCELYRGFWALMAPLVILGGIYSGFFTPTEAAIVAIFYTLIVGAFIYRELTWEKLFTSLETTTWLTGRVLLIMFTATVFGRLLVENQIPAIIADGMLSITDNIYIIWTLVILFLLFVGMFMETLATILILVPVMLPVAYSMGIDPIHFGVVMVCTLGIGFQTPPLGENLFIASGISNISIERISVAALPFAFINTVAIFIIAFVPEIALWLPRFFGY